MLDRQREEISFVKNHLFGVAESQCTPQGLFPEELPMGHYFSEACWFREIKVSNQTCAPGLKILEGEFYEVKLESKNAQITETLVFGLPITHHQESHFREPSSCTREPSATHDHKILTLV